MGLGTSGVALAGRLDGGMGSALFRFAGWLECYVYPNAFCCFVLLTRVVGDEV
jgi:hypothetical protein